MTHRLLAGILASLATMCMMFGRPQALSAALFKPAQVPSVDRQALPELAGPTDAAPEVVWPSHASARLLEVVYVYANRAPVTRTGLSDVARRDRQEA